ncbi:hypothetical protein RhiirA1_519059 [Rhizophagus irregularis]|uniref:Galactose oxidase n=1 Tax=Rhizophagus irregularis TaxID=588596 RepID=A0A2N0RJT3_9GLOM|nr:hypothetical protein RhiirA1_519059 [Rhizophagus irregularis]
MSRNSSVYYILWILIQVLVKVNCQMTPFKPSVYYRHTTTFIDNKLYILSGWDLNNNPIKEFFYLDVSVPFNTQEVSWQDLSNINMVPLHSSATSVKGGPNNDTLFLYGGSSSDQTMELVYTFDSQRIVWSIPKIAGVNTIRKWGLTGIINNDGKMYLWSGSTNTDYVNEMLILDTINLNWSKGRFDGKRIIIFGGYFINSGYLDTSLYVLDLNNYNWYIPKISGKIPKPRALHKANVIGKYMVISFGDGYDKTIESDILLLDISNNDEYIWTTIFDPKMPSPPPSPPSTLPPLPPPSPPPSPSPSPSLSSSSPPNNSAVKNEIGQNLKNELLQAVREDNLNITRNNTKQD